MIPGGKTMESSQTIGMITKNYYGMTRESLADWLRGTEEGKRAVGILNGINERRGSRIMTEGELADSFITSMEDELAVKEFLERRTGCGVGFGGGTRHFEFHLWEPGDGDDAKRRIRFLNSLPDITWMDAGASDSGHDGERWVEVKSIRLSRDAGEEELKAHLIHKMHFMNIHGAETVAFVIHRRNEFQPDIMIYDLREGWVS